MQECKPFKEGKVREVYDNGDSLIIVATDRISAHILLRHFVLCDNRLKLVNKIRIRKVTS